MKKFPILPMLNHAEQILIDSLKSIVETRFVCLHISVFCPGFQKGRVPSEKGTFSAVNGPSKGHH